MRFPRFQKLWITKRYRIFHKATSKITTFHLQTTNNSPMCHLLQILSHLECWIRTYTWRVGQKDRELRVKDMIIWITKRMKRGWNSWELRLSASIGIYWMRVLQPFLLNNSNCQVMISISASRISTSFLEGNLQLLNHLQWWIILLNRVSTILLLIRTMTLLGHFYRITGTFCNSLILNLKSKYSNPFLFRMLSLISRCLKHRSQMIMSLRWV